MKSLTRALAMLALAGLVVGLLGAGVILASDHIDNRGLTVVVLLGIGAAWIGTGLYAWWRRPVNRVGALMTWTGFAWLLNVFVAADTPAIFTAAMLAANLYLAAFVHLLVAYPEGTSSGIGGWSRRLRDRDPRSRAVPDVRLRGRTAPSARRRRSRSRRTRRSARSPTPSARRSRSRSSPG